MKANILSLYSVVLVVSGCGSGQSANTPRYAQSNVGAASGEGELGLGVSIGMLKSSAMDALAARRFKVILVRPDLIQVDLEGKATTGITFLHLDSTDRVWRIEEFLAGGYVSTAPVR